LATTRATTGHDAGDDLVRKICTALSAEVPAGGVLARLGGDEFGVIIVGATDVGLAKFCAQLLRICGQCRRVSGHEVQVSASIGVAHQGDHQSQIEMMRHADLALNAAKREGRNRYRVYDTAIDRAARHRLSIESGLERAMNASQFKMAYQPIVNAQDGAILGFEALIRWDSPEHGVISPADFVPIAEETGLILDLGDWITRQALKDCRRWGGPYVSVNLSARQFLRHNVAERILRYAADANVPPQRIQIELTETAIIESVEWSGPTRICASFAPKACGWRWTTLALATPVWSISTSSPSTASRSTSRLSTMSPPTGSPP
jgi:predicted signal transduction protein with EAL and GGDEF domain